MSTDGNAVAVPKPLWPASGDVEVSDEAILGDLVGKLNPKAAENLTPDVIYKSLIETRKASDVWVKYYFISVALALMVATGAMTEFSLFGAKLNGSFLAPLAIIYFSVCTVAYTNFELKNRLYKAFFDSLITGVAPAERVEKLLRYPLAFEGGKFIPHDMTPGEAKFGWLHILGLLPAAGALKTAWLISVFGLMMLLFYDLYITAMAGLPPVITIATFLGFGGAMTVSAHFLRDPKRPRKYVIEKKDAEPAALKTGPNSEASPA